VIENVEFARVCLSFGVKEAYFRFGPYIADTNKDDVEFPIHLRLADGTLDVRTCMM